MLVSVKCLFMGHEDIIRAKEQRVFLSCAHCGRETHGWDLAEQDQRMPSAMHPEPHSAVA